MTGPVSVVGIDPSLTRAGIASITNTDGAVEAGTITHVGYAGHDGAPWWRRSRRIIAEARDIAAVFNEIHQAAPIVLAVIEGPAWGTNMPSKFDRDGLWWAVFSVLDAKHIPVTVVNPVTRAKFITGTAPRGRGHKELVLTESQSTWVPAAHRIKNHDQADALGLAHMGALHLGWQLPVETRRRHVENIAADKVQWSTEWVGG